MRKQNKNYKVSRNFDTYKPVSRKEFDSLRETVNQHSYALEEHKSVINHNAVLLNDTIGTFLMFTTMTTGYLLIDALAGRCQDKRIESRIKALEEKTAK
ncbi:MAG TPA: hypothetical protein DCW90_21870 [Lachnospiraceae bacterium]|nr:hypothetical protein [Lachnospiraceae bacterium]